MFKNNVEAAYILIVIAFITLVPFNGFIAKILGGVSLLAACYFIGKLGRRTK